MSLSTGKTKIPFNSSFSSNLLRVNGCSVAPCESVRTPTADFYEAVVVSRSTLRCDNGSFTVQRLIIARRALTAQRGQWIRDWRNERLRWGHCTLTAQQLVQDRRALEAQLDEWIRDWRNEGLRSKHYALAAQDRRALEAQRDQWIRYWRNERLRSEHCAFTAQRMVRDRHALTAQRDKLI